EKKILEIMYNSSLFNEEFENFIGRDTGKIEKFIEKFEVVKRKRDGQEIKTVNDGAYLVWGGENPFIEPQLISIQGQPTHD
ncbi:MAG TPA: hypothetical protein VFD17_01435, partial [Clostridia bacterium]|nr:hypothetical protein [Clostridia bacterium]